MNQPLNESMLKTKEERKKDIWSALIWAIIIYVLSQIILGVLSAFVIVLISSMTGEAYTAISENGTFNTLFTSYGSIVSIALTFQVAKMLENRSNRSLGFAKIHSTSAIKYIFYGLALAIIISLFQMFFGKIDISINTDFNLLIILAYALGIVIQSFSDNLLYRGYLMNALSVENNVMLAIVVSSATATIPALLSQNFTLFSILNTFMLQIILGMIFYLSDNIAITTLFSSMFLIIVFVIFGSPYNGQSTIHTVFSYSSQSATAFAGGNMGIMGSLYTTFILTILVFIIYNLLNLNQNKD